MEPLPSSPSPAPAASPEAPPRTRPSMWARYRLLLWVSLGVTVLDQVTKALVRTHLPFGHAWAPWPAPWSRWVRLVHWRNTGAAFGLYQGANDLLMWIALAVIVVVVWHFRHAALEERCLRWGLALQVGGALGNLLDRVQHGSVTDFLAVARFPVFNLADVAITLGVVCLLWSTLTEDRSATTATTTVPPGATAAPQEPASAPAEPVPQTPPSEPRGE